MIYYGIDDNGNGVLDETERDGSITICNAGLVTMTGEPAGGHCAQGGVRCDLGMDDGAGGGVAGDNQLQPGEITDTYWICTAGSNEEAVAAVELAPWVRHHGTVAASGKSHYLFSPGTETPNRMWIPGLTRTESDLGWSLYVSSTLEPVGDACNNFENQDADEFCLTPILDDAETYLLVVEEFSSIPNLFDIEITDSMLLAGDSMGRIFRMNPDDGNLNLLAETGIEGMTSLASRQVGNGVQFWAGTNDCDLDCLLDIDPISGANSPVLVDTPAILAMAVDPDGVLYTMQSDGVDSVRWLDEENLEWSYVDVGPVSYAESWGMVIDGGYTLNVAAKDETTPNEPARLWDYYLPTPQVWEELTSTYHEIRVVRYDGEDTVVLGVRVWQVRSMATNLEEGTTYVIGVDDRTFAPTAFLMLVNLGGFDPDAQYVAPVPLNLTSLMFLGPFEEPYNP